MVMMSLILLWEKMNKIKKKLNNNNNNNKINLSNNKFKIIRTLNKYSNPNKIISKSSTKKTIIQQLMNHFNKIIQTIIL